MTFKIDNERKYLTNLLNTGNAGQKKWAKEQANKYGFSLTFDNYVKYGGKDTYIQSQRNRFHQAVVDKNTDLAEKIKADAERVGYELPLPIQNNNVDQQINHSQKILAYQQAMEQSGQKVPETKTDYEYQKESVQSANTNVNTAISSRGLDLAREKTRPELTEVLPFEQKQEALGKGETIPQAYKEIVQEAANTYGVPVSLISKIIQVESGWNHKAKSRVGAMGMMQLMPRTAKALGVSNPYDPGQNIMGGVKYLSSLIKKYKGDMTLAVAAYNAGPGNVDKYKGVPPFKETQNFVKKVLGS